MKQKPIIFSLSANKDLTTKVCKILKLQPGKIHKSKFADGEMIVYSSDSVRGKDIFVIQSTSSPANDHIMELLIFIDGLKRASARSITVVTPYFGYARQDRKTIGRQPISAKLVANLLTVAGIDRLITVNLHASQIQGFFDLPVDNLNAIRILGKKIKSLKIDNIVIASPDYGGVDNARRLTNILAPGQAIAGIDKIRVAKNASEIMHVYGDVAGRSVVVLDDIVDTGGTIIQAAKTFYKQGAKEIYLAFVHPVLSADTFEKMTKLDFVKKIFVTDTIELKKKHPKVEVVSISEYLSAVIQAILDNESVSVVYRKYGKSRNE